MTKRTAFWLACLAILGVVTFVACGGDGPSAPSPVSVAPAPTQSGGTAAAPAPAPSPNPIGAPGIDVQLVSSTFDPDRCTQLRDEQGNLTSYGKLSELVEVAKVTNNTDAEVYAKPAIYHTDIATCGALDSNPGGVVGLMEAENIPPGASKNWTHRFPIDENACGAYQFDNDAKNGTVSRSTLGGGDGGKVINTGRNCPSCEAFNVVLTVTGEGLTRTVKVTFEGQKPAAKALVDFGDGTSVQMTNGQSVEHTWPYGEYIVKATLEAEGISCYKSVTVKNEKVCQVEWIEQEPEITYGEWGECKKPSEASQSTATPECSQSRSVRTVIKEKNSCTGELRVKSDTTKTESRPCDCKYSCDDLKTSFEEVSCVAAAGLTPTVKKCFSGSFSAGTASVDFGDSSPAQAIPGSPFNTNHNYEQTGATQYFTATMNVAYQGLTCPKSAKVEIPPQEKKECRLGYYKDVSKTTASDGDTLRYTLRVENEGTADCTGGGVKLEDKEPENIDFVRSSGTVGQCRWDGPVEWNCGTIKPGVSITVWWEGKVDNPKGNCNDLTIKNKATVWSDQTGTLWSNEVVTTVDIVCGPTCPPGQTTTSVNWSNLRESTFGSNPKCGDFGLTSLYKKEFQSGVENWSTDRDASIVIVKDGKCEDEYTYYAKKVSPQDSSKWIKSGLGVSFSCNGKKKDLSHVEMCGCPVGDANAASGSLFDPYQVSDPSFE
jgi:uncharacterized repeat protein (TIGR01451 family)